ncbi:similar to Saccharomyces cerevisiae YBR077C SLM4 Component of the EGO complex [Maudiozyma barnettii]|uniref:Similar to Saccharomyces cerevisiae YBR077C SLM4 Component of the EGO complex n=1 Tax=Maudiozyma barnettii TaxID=61262 RepID=A0A8H2VK45_9SACH|nr:Slm4p [Kazachstania barnettii]CAB4256843.1 similar to Saccharomyces cerevisiae YBR077C SLM4 Component of the EGO complex [Kazachstania barnettii]CAD1785261.1 similar to Saccharomyces cerevisiae YBR077C SLM4 Component of the EGO complex [Kazachstania barnettii]
MIHEAYIEDLLHQTLKPFATDSQQLQIQSAILLSTKNGSVLSYSTNLNLLDDSNTTNNETSLKLMTLLCKDKWDENENDEPEPHYIFKWDSYETRIYNYEIENLHAAITKIPNSDLLLLLIADPSFPYGLLTLKMKYLLKSCNSLINYKLNSNE